MLIRKPSDVPPSEITPERVWHARRAWMGRAAAGAAALGLAGWSGRQARAQGGALAPLPGTANPQFIVMDKQTSYGDITSYNNYYEFGVDKGDPA